MLQRFQVILSILKNSSQTVVKMRIILRPWRQYTDLEIVK